MKYPFTKKVDVVDDYHGTKVADPYRWLEDSESRDVKDWLSMQLDFTEKYFAGLPLRNRIRREVERFFKGDRLGFASSVSRAGQMLFFRKTCQVDGRTRIVMRKGIDGADKVLFDPGDFSDSFAYVATYDVTDDGKLCMLIMYKSGSDFGELYVADLETGKVLPDEPIKDFGTPCFWKDGIIYTSPKRENDSATGKLLSLSVKFHKLGTKPEDDKIMIECSDLGINEKPSKLLCLTKDDWMIAEVFTNKWGFYFKKVDEPNSSFHKFFDEPTDFNCGFMGKIDGKWVYINGSQLMFVDPARPDKENCTKIFDFVDSNIVPESIRIKQNKIFAQVNIDGKLVLQQFDASSKYIKSIDGGEGNTLYLMHGKVIGDDDNKTTMLRTSFTNPDQMLLFDMKTGEMQPIPTNAGAIDRIDTECRYEMYKSKDGTMVPLTMYYRKGLDLTKVNPVLLEAYGGYGMINKPYFRVRTRIFVEHGGIFAVAGVRGGGEFGKSWHRAGSRENKQNSIDDFVAAAEYMTSQGITDSRHLAILGGSEGARLISASVNYRPDLFAVAIAQNGAYDKLRYHKFSFSKSFMTESGCSDNPDDFKWIYKLSPLHNVKIGEKYPAMMIVTNSNDSKCQPLHSFKFVALLQEAQSANKPVLLKYFSDSGHFDKSPDKVIEETTDILTFIYENIGFEPI